MPRAPQPMIIDPSCLEDRPQVFEETLRPEVFPRLMESLANGDGELHYRVTARLGKQLRKEVSCIIEGFVFLTCQTSLEPFRHDIAIDDRLVLVDTEAELPSVEEESETEDYLVADEPLDIRDLVEDAVLLALPMVPRKPGLEASRQGREDAVRKESPFAALASLKKDKR